MTLAARARLSGFSVDEQASLSRAADLVKRALDKAGHPFSPIGASQTMDYAPGMSSVIGAAVPTFVPITTPGKPTVSSSLSQAEARRQLGLHQNALSKLLDSGYLSLQETCVEAAARADFMTITSGRVVVIQTDVVTVSAETPPWRPYVGDGPGLTDTEWLDASRGDWHGFDPHQALTAGYALITLGTYITGVIRLRQLELSRHDRYQTKHRFKAQIVARLTGAGASLPPLADPHRSRHEVACGPGERALAQLLGQRIRPKAGPQAYLWDPSSAAAHRSHPKTSTAKVIS